VTTPGGSDGLVRPLGAPSGNQVLPGIQPGTTGGTVLAQYVIVYGSSSASGAGPGVFIYSGSPGPGNPPIYSESNATEDPYGNAIAPGIWAGKYGGIQAGLDTEGSVGQVVVPTGGPNEVLAGGMAGLRVGSGSYMQLFSPREALSGAGSDRMVLDFQSPSSATPVSASWSAVYIDTAGVPHIQVLANYAGTQLLGGVTAATQPGTGTGPGNAAVVEGWHTATLQNGWTAPSGVAGVYYQLLPWGLGGTVEVIGDVQHATATGNSVFATLPAGYTPGGSQNHPAAWNNPVASNSASVPWVNVSSGGALQMTGIEQANHETFFHIFIPLGTL